MTAAVAIPLITTAASMMYGAYSSRKERERIEEQNRKQNMMRSIEQRYSPWLGSAQTPSATRVGPSTVDGAVRGAFQGYSLWQNIQSAQQQQKLIDAKTKLIEKAALQYGTKSGVNIKSGQVNPDKYSSDLKNSYDDVSKYSPQFQNSGAGGLQNMKTSPNADFGLNQSMWG